MRPLTRSRYLIVTAALLAITAASTACVDSIVTEHGSGHLETREYAVGEFDRIEAHDALRVTVRIDPDAAPSVVVTLDDNLFEFLDVRVAGATLILDAIRNIDADSSAIVEVVAPSLEGIDVSGAVTLEVTGGVGGDDVELEASGASRVRVDSIEAGDVHLRASGASRISISGGFIAELEGDASGASFLDLREVSLTGDASLDLSGASQAEVTAAGRVSGSASGASSLVVYGDPSSVDVSTSGASNVRVE